METLPGQQLEAPRYNHPCEDLLDSGRREEYIKICVPLFRASIRGDLEAAKVILQGREYLVRYCITEQKETPLHVVAAKRNNSEFVKYLVDMMSEDDLKLQNEEGNNAFCLAAIAGNINMARILLQKNRELLTIRGSGNMMPLYLAVFHKQRHMITYLYDHSQRTSSDHGWTDDDRISVFMECIKIERYDVALQMLNDREEFPQYKYLWNVLWVLAQKDNVFYEPVRMSLVDRMYDMENLHTGKESKEATHLLTKIWKRIVVKNKDEIDEILRGPVVKIGEKDKYPSRILFVAAENGNIKFLVVLIREYPDLIWKTNDDGKTIFHIGVINGYYRILDLLYELGAMKDKITRLEDKDGNTLLHSIWMNAERNLHRPDDAGHMLTQLICFKKVQAMVPPSYQLLKNAAGQTPREIFSQNHKDIFPVAQKWIKDTSNQCMLVAALISSIAFSAAFSIPGGYNQTTGFPIFLTNTPFLAFVILDGISFILSSVAILIFLSLSFCRYSEDDFFNSITPTLALGIAALTCSILTLIAAFSANFFVLYHYKLLPVPIFMSLLATSTIFMYYFFVLPAIVDKQLFTVLHLYIVTEFFSTKIEGDQFG